jgi:hypothetical protein
LKILFFHSLDSSSIFGNFIFSFFRFIPAGPPAGALRGKSLKELRRFFRIFGNFIFHFLDSFRIFGNFTFSFFKLFQLITLYYDQVTALEEEQELPALVT